MIQQLEIQLEIGRATNRITIDYGKSVTIKVREEWSDPYLGSSL